MFSRRAIVVLVYAKRHTVAESTAEPSRDTALALGEEEKGYLKIFSEQVGDADVPYLFSSL